MIVVLVFRFSVPKFGQSMLKRLFPTWNVERILVCGV